MILTTIALVAQASPAATASPAIALPDNAKVDANAKAWFISLQQGKVLDASMLTSQMTSLLTPALVTGLANKIGPLGAPTSFKLAQSGVKDDNKFYIYDLGFKTGDTLRFAIAFDTSGKVSGLQVLPPQ